MWPKLPHLLFTNTARLLSFLLLLSAFFLSACRSVKLFKETTRSGMSAWNSQLKHMMLHARYSRCSRVSAIRSSILLERARMFPMTITSKHGLYRLFLSRCLTPARQPFLLFSAGTSILLVKGSHVPGHQQLFTFLSYLCCSNRLCKSGSWGVFTWADSLRQAFRGQLRDRVFSVCPRLAPMCIHR